MNKQQSNTLKFKSPRLNKEIVSSQFTFKIDPNLLDYPYFTVQGNTCRMNWTGSWSSVIGDKGVKQGVQHYKLKIKKSLEKHQLIGYIAAEEKHQPKQWSQFLSQNYIFSHDGSTRTKGVTKFMKKEIKQGDTLQCICDIPNGLISWVLEQSGQVIAQSQILPQFKGKQMVPLIALEDIGDLVEIMG